MKKSLLALAMMGAFAGAAQAQVTLYGLVDVGVTYADNGDDTRVGMDSGIAGATRWGMKGSEDLGGGLNAHFVLEQGFEADSGEASNADRQFHRLSYAGLKGGFGTVRLGRQNTVMKEATGDMDPFGAAGMANIHDYLLGGIDQRRANTLTYITPDFGGFNASVQYNFGDEVYAGADADIFGARVGYENGPIAVQLAHETLSDANGAGNDQQDTIIGGAYDFGIAKLHAAYGQRSNDVGSDFKSAMLGASAKFGNGKVMASYTVVENDDVPNSDSDVFAIGYNYSLSKRTMLTARYVNVSNDAGVGLGVAGAGVGDVFGPVRDGEDSNVLGLGVQHKF